MAPAEAAVPRTYTLLGADRRPYRKHGAGAVRRPPPGPDLRPTRTARRPGGAIARGATWAHRVFFADQPTAVAAGYRPCAVCLPAAYAAGNRAGGG